MIWLTDTTIQAPTLPAAWLVETPLRPGTLPERSLLRRSVAASLIATQFSLPVADVVLAHDTKGRPLVDGMVSSKGRPCVSYATREGVVLVALNHGVVGADVEYIAALPEIPWKVLHPRERDMLMACPERTRTVAFYRLWTAKEAFGKANGDGLLREPSAFALRFFGDQARCEGEPGLLVKTRVFTLGQRAFACAVACQG
jgi:4'-phosphopantetheinyl transferase